MFAKYEVVIETNYSENNEFHTILDKYVNSNFSKYSKLHILASIFFNNSGLTKNTTIFTLLNETMLPKNLDYPQII